MTSGFDDALVVDWSAAATPRSGADSCWVAAGSLTSSTAIRTYNPTTRHDAARLIDRLLDRSLNRGRRTLVAIDVSFGLPFGAASTLGLEGEGGWKSLWANLEARGHDDEQNKNNRFEVAHQLNVEAGVRCFWGRPIAPAFDQFWSLPVKDISVEGLDRNPLPRLRRCELLAGPGVISNWMLVGKGAVGGQVMTCLPYLERLRRRLGTGISVWPFEGLGDTGTDVVLAETWHGLFPWREDRAALRDEAQVRATLRALRGLGHEGRGRLLAPDSLMALSPTARGEVLAEEGWTLGVQ